MSCSYQANVWPNTSCRQRGFTLVEVVVNLSVLAILMGGLGSAIYVSSRALPSANDLAESSMQAARVVDQLVADVAVALSFTQRTDLSAQFRVADRTGDSVEETLQYSWSGVSGEPLTRMFNGQAALPVADNVQYFDLNYVTKTVSSTAVSVASDSGPESLIAMFDGWDTIALPGSSPTMISNVQWAAECFRIVPPKSATSLQFTRADVVMQRDLAPASLRVDATIHTATTDAAGLVPAAAALGPGGSAVAGGLLAAFTWTSIPLTGTSTTNMSQLDYCLRLAGDSAPPVIAQSYFSATAPVDDQVLRWSSNAGATWQPASGIDNRDLRYRLYGQYAIPSIQTQTANYYQIVLVEVQLQLGSDSSSRVYGAAHVMEKPSATLVQVQELQLAPQ